MQRRGKTSTSKSTNMNRESGETKQRKMKSAMKGNGKHDEF
jgi:hypothetical protein